MISPQVLPRVLHFVRLTAWVKASFDVLGQFSAKGDGKSTVMRYIIRDQAGMTDLRESKRISGQVKQVCVVIPYTNW